MSAPAARDGTTPSAGTVSAPPTDSRRTPVGRAWRALVAVTAAVLVTWLVVRWGLLIVPVAIAVLLAARTLAARHLPARAAPRRSAATRRAVPGSARLSPLRGER